MLKNISLMMFKSDILLDSTLEKNETLILSIVIIT